MRQIILDAGRKPIMMMLNHENTKNSQKMPRRITESRLKKRRGLEELADLLEVIHALAKVHGSSHLKK